MEYTSAVQISEAAARAISSLRSPGTPQSGAWLPNGRGGQHRRVKQPAPSAAAVAAASAAAEAAAAEDARLSRLEDTFAGLETTVGGLQTVFDEFAVQQVAHRVAITSLLERLAL